MKAIFIVSILFIVFVGVFGIFNQNNRYRNRNNTRGNETTKHQLTKENEEVKSEANTDTQNQNGTAQSEKIQEKSTNSSDITEQKKDLTKDVTNEKKLTKEEDTEKTEKDQYLERLNSIVSYYDDLWSKTDSYSMADMKELKNQEYTKWDDELNTIYQLVKKKLPEEEFIPLRDEERKWITNRDEQASLAINKYAGGTMEGLEYMSVMTNLTKERTYKLVDIYFEE